MKKRVFCIILSVVLLFGCMPSQVYAATTSSTEVTIWRYLRGLGYSEAATAGIMGNAMAESSMRPGAHSANAFTTGSGSFGLFAFEVAHWNTGYQGYKYKKWLEDHGHSWNSWDTAEHQLEYLFGSGKAFENTLKSKVNGTQTTNSSGYLVGWPVKLSLSDFKNMTNPREAADFFLMVYERPAKPVTNGKRANYAEQYYDKYAVNRVIIDEVKLTTDGIKISWNAFKGTRNYYIYESINGGKYKKVGTTSKTSWIQKTSSKGATYKYYIKAVNVGKKTLAGDEFTNKSITIDKAPDLTGIVKTSTGYDLSWEPSTGTDVAGYRIYQKIDGGSWEKLSETAKTTTTVKGLVTGRKYSYRVAAIDAAGNLASRTSDTRTGGFVAPVSVTAKPSNVETGKIIYKWNTVSGAGGYQIQYATNPQFTNAKTVTIKKGTAASYTLSRLTRGKTYYIRIRARKKIDGKTYYSVWSEKVVTCSVKK